MKKNKLILQNNTIDKKTNKVIFSNSRDEKRLKKQKELEQQQNNKQQEEQKQEIDVDSSNNSNNGNNTIGSYFSSIYRSIYDWMYIKNFSFFSSVLQCGAIPRHIGVIMDGNRRFARKSHLETSEGHKLGYSKLLELCQWGLYLGVQIISVYAFSIENFKRPAHEVNDLMDLANEKFEELLSNSSKLQKMGVRVKIIGDISLIPEKLQITIAKAMKATESNTKALLNICMSYTSHDEMLHSMNTISKGVEDNLIKTEDIDQNLLENCLYIKEDLDILVRTSGEYRLSDFMLWQSCFSSINFLNVLWPDFTCFHFFYIIFLYQCNHRLVNERQKNRISTAVTQSITDKQQQQQEQQKELNSSDRIREFIELIQKNEKNMFDQLLQKQQCTAEK